MHTIVNVESTLTVRPRLPGSRLLVEYWLNNVTTKFVSAGLLQPLSNLSTTKIIISFNFQKKLKWATHWPCISSTYFTTNNIFIINSFYSNDFICICLRLKKISLYETNLDPLAVIKDASRGSKIFPRKTTANIT